METFFVRTVVAGPFAKRNCVDFGGWTTLWHILMLVNVCLNVIKQSWWTDRLTHEGSGCVAFHCNTTAFVSMEGKNYFFKGNAEEKEIYFTKYQTFPISLRSNYMIGKHGTDWIFVILHKQDMAYLLYILHFS